MNKALLVILDGWGIGTVEHADAIRAAETRFVDGLYDKYPHAALVTHGAAVGLPEGQMGNSEVGHLNIGAGRVIYQELARINKSIAENTLGHEKTVQDLISYCRIKSRPIHLIGLLSDGGVHSHIDHLLALMDIFNKEEIEMALHVFLDGRDTDPKGGYGYLKTLTEYCKGRSAQLVSVVGRYYAMDRDLRWERIKRAYDLLVAGEGIKSDDILSDVQKLYEKGITDEFIEPVILDEKKCLKPNDAVLFFNFRTDRPRQITRALTQEDFPIYGMIKLHLKFVTMTNYDDTFENIDVVFEKDVIDNTLGKIIADKGLSQVRIAETEKHPHVTFFFSGGAEEELVNEKRILVPSPKVATYDLQPEMSATEVTEAIVEEIMTNSPDFICLNYANADMVGHTGDFEAAKKAVHTVDSCLKDLVEVALAENYRILIIADHGNSDYMINEDGSPNTAHTTNLVPVIYVANGIRNKVRIRSGTLADVAPTILKMMGIEQPIEIAGESLINTIV